jgi:CheY-specific phosphatase CheX
MPETLTSEEVERLLTQAAFEAGMALFSAYDVSLEPADLDVYQARGNLNLISVVGFAGRQIAGTLVLGATEEPLQLSMPQGASARDWIGELANQLLGRIKNKVLRRGIEIYAMPPAVVSGEHLTPVTSRQDFEPLLFATPSGVVCLWIEIELPREVTPDPSVGQGEIPTEGDVILF